MVILRECNKLFYINKIPFTGSFKVMEIQFLFEGEWLISMFFHQKDILYKKISEKECKKGAQIFFMI